jgi:hypothetical protein
MPDRNPTFVFCTKHIRTFCRRLSLPEVWIYKSSEPSVYRQRSCIAGRRILNNRKKRSQVKKTFFWICSKLDATAIQCKLT